MSLFVQKRSIVWVVIGVAFVSVVIVVVNAVLQTRATQKTNVPKIDTTAETLKTVKKLAEKIDSCTDPAGACAQRGQRQTAEAVGNIKADTRAYVIATLVCQQQGVTGYEPIARCVDRTIAAAAQRSPGKR